MAELETVTILRVGTDEAVKSVADLRENVKTLKKTLDTLEIGTEEYQDTLDELKVNQNALKDAMYATSSSMGDLSKAATGTAESYNGLVHRMAALKEELRATDVSTEEGRKRFEQLAAQVNGVNDKLKEMDALQGNFQRNVGNYQSAFKGMSEKVDVFRKSLGSASGGLNGVKDGLEGISKSPAIATFGILVSVLVKLGTEVAKDDKAMAAFKKALAALKPVMDVITTAVSWLADLLADVIGEVTDFLGSSGLIQKVIQGVMGVGNAILQFVISPFKGVLAAIKVFKEQGVKGLGDAARAFGEEMKSGVSFRENFGAGQAVADALISGARSRKDKVKAAGKETAKDFLEGLDLGDLTAEIDKALEDGLAAVDRAGQEADKLAAAQADRTLKRTEEGYKRLAELNEIQTEDERERADKAYQIQREGNERRLALLEEFAAAALERGDMDAYLKYSDEAADMEVQIELDALKEKERIRKRDAADAEKTVKARKDLLKGLASSTSSILGTIADAYEAQAEEGGKSAGKVKALRIAAAMIDTISGAVGAFMQASQTIPPPAGQIVGAASAAAVTATGLAQIAAMRNVKAGDGSSPSVSTPSMPVTAAAPSLDVSVPQVRTLTSASEEDRLNRMAADQRVYILDSDLQAAGERRRALVAETSF